MDLGLRDGARDGGGFGVDEGSGIAADVHGFRGLAKIKLDVYGIGLLRNDSQILKNFLFETFLLNAERVTTGSEGAKRVQARIIAGGFQGTTGRLVGQSEIGAGNDGS